MNTFAGVQQGKFDTTSSSQNFLHHASIRSGGIAFAALALSLSIFNSAASAQSPILQKGDGVITGFSGVVVPSTPFPPGVNPIDEILIDPEGASAQILRLAPQSPLQGQVLTPSVFKIKAKDVGQVFGVALDDAPVKNIYLGATSAFGLQILVRDSDGKPERAKLGGARTTFMPGQFGKDGGPGSIYKVNGTTGAVSIFATIPGNSGPGIGQLSFDPATHQLFASDLDTGLIHSIDASGKLGATFDHGTTGRTAAGLPAVADDGATMNVTSSSFNAEDAATWGFTPKARRIGGLAVHAGRLYYAVAEGPQVWSVSLNSSGAFGNDAKLEIDAQTLGSPNAVASITFDSSGVIYLAQRGDTSGSYDYSTFAEPNNATVARFRRDPANLNAWMALPEFYAVGADPDYRSAAGGVDIGLGVAASGTPSGQCNMLWSTGDALKKLGTGANAGIIHGLQGNDVNAVRPADTPPMQTNFVDYDQTFADPTALGHIGSIAVWRNCDGAPALTAQLPYVPGAGSGGYYPGPNYPTDYETGSHLTIHKVADSGACIKGPKSFCHYTVTVTNDGPDPYFGTIIISDQVPTPFDYGVLVADASADPWKCQGNGSNAMQCSLTGATLNVGDKKTFKVHVRIDDAPKAPCDVHNTASLISPPGKSSSASANFPDGSCKKTPHLVVKKEPVGICEGAGPWNCYYNVTLTNDGKAEYTGPIVIEESTFITGATITDVSGVFDCGTPAQTVTCKPKVAKPLAVNGTLTMKAKVQVPIAGTNPPKCSIQNSATLKSPAGNTSSATDQLPPDAKCSDIHVSKKFDDCKLTGDTVTCNFTATFRNTIPFSFYSK